MEPQHGQINVSGMPQQVYGRKKSRSGCFIIGFLIILIIGGGITYVIYSIYNKVNDTVENFSDTFKNMKNSDRFNGKRNVDDRFKGEFIDAILIPVTGSTPKLFMLTDGSKSYIETQKRPGYYSTGSACIDCKTIVYVYDPQTNNIIKNTEYNYPDVITSTEIALKDNKVYQFTGSYHETPAGVNIYDAQTGELLTETKEFTAQFPELNSGITGLNYREKDRYATFETKDGRKNILFSVDYGKIFENDRELGKLLESTAEGEGTIYAMANLSNDSRRQLFRVTVPKKHILTHYSTMMEYAGRENMLKNYNGTSEKVSDKNYIEGILYAQDEDYAFVISLDEAGKKANRIFTCIDAKTGKEKWSVQQSELFDYMKIDEIQNSSQSLSSTKDKITVQRLGNIVILKLKGDGVMAFDTETGKKLWAIQTAPVSL